MTDLLKLQPVNLQQAGAAPQSRYNEEELKKLKKSCADFESIFTYQLIKTMRATIPKGEKIGESYGKETYTMMMDQKLAEEISSKGDGLGLKKVLYEQLTGQHAKEVVK
ncbi:MAG: rod-binding protein [Smithellaceae bacterium]